MITYRIEAADPNAHLFRVTLSVARPLPEQRLSLPAWIPGSYLVREFARHLSALQASQVALSSCSSGTAVSPWLACSALRWRANSRTR